MIPEHSRGRLGESMKGTRQWRLLEWRRHHKLVWITFLRHKNWNYEKEPTKLWISIFHITKGFDFKGSPFRFFFSSSKILSKRIWNRHLIFIFFYDCRLVLCAGESHLPVNNIEFIFKFYCDFSYYDGIKVQFRKFKFCN